MQAKKKKLLRHKAATRGGSRFAHIVRTPESITKAKPADATCRAASGSRIFENAGKFAKMRQDLEPSSFSAEAGAACADRNEDSPGQLVPLRLCET